MSKKELRKLNRAELLELLVVQTERADRLTAELQEAKDQIRNREDLIRQAGELASAAAKLINMLEGGSGVTVHNKTNKQIKDTKHEKNGIDPSAIIAITSGIGKGKI